MASTFSDLLRLEIQASGENDSTWGSRANTVFEMIEDAIANFKSVVLAADANYVLTTANSATDEARNMGLNFTSSLSLTATRNITVPTSTKSYFVKNGTTGGQSLQIKTAAGTGITIPNGKTALVLCDGVNVIMGFDWVNALAFGDAPTTRTNLGVAIGSNVEAWDADLDAIAALGSTGIAVRSAANTWVQRALAQPAAGITITNSDGSAGNPTLALANDLLALEGMAGTGFVSRTASEAYAQRTLQAPAAGLTISNPAGVAGDPAFALANDLSALEGLGSTGIAVRTAADTWAQRNVVAGAGIVVTNGDGVAGNPTVASNIPQNSKSANYTTTLTDTNGHLLHPSTDNNPRTFTIDSNANVAYPIGTAISFVNEINVVTIAITSDTMTMAGTGTTGSRSLAANGIATALKVGTTKWVISGTGLS